MQIKKEMLIDRNELQILLNLIGEDQIIIGYPLFDLKLMRLISSKDGYRCSVLCDLEDFQNINDYTNYGNEFPLLDEIKYCMLLSGMLNYENMADFQEKLDAISKLNKSLYLAPDTNLFYHGALSGLTDQNTHYIVVDTVYDEIEHPINHKYQPYLIKQMESDAKYHGELLHELKNKKLKKARKASYVALKEYRHIRDHLMELRPCEQTTSSGEDNDRIIVRSLREFEASNGHIITLLLTADSNMAELCAGKGPECFHFIYPSSMEVRRCSPEQLKDLIYYFAIVFGVIKCNSVIIYGEFSYKEADDESLKLVFQDEVLYEKFNETIGVCRDLMALNIEK